MTLNGIAKGYTALKNDRNAWIDNCEDEYRQQSDKYARDKACLDFFGER